MLDLPRLLYFQNKNTYSANQAEMRYRAIPGKQKAEDGSDQAVLTVEIWPGPWTIEYTDPALRQKQVYPLTEEGLQAARDWIRATWEADPDKWASAPSILDCEPWTDPPKEENEE